MRLGGVTVAFIALFLGATIGAAAQTPPARVFGSVTVNGSAPPAGTVVEAFVEGRACGSGEVRDLGAPVGIGYIVDVRSDSSTPGCARDGATVAFKVGGLDAAENVTFQTGAFIQQSLTAQGQPASPPPATASPPPAPSPTPQGGATPAPSPTASSDVGPSPGASPSPSPSPADTPSPAPTGSPSASPSAAVTPSPTLIAAEGGDDGDGGVPGAVWLALGAGLLAGAGVAAYLYFRGRSGPPA